MVGDASVLEKASRHEYAHSSADDRGSGYHVREPVHAVGADLHLGESAVGPCIVDKETREAEYTGRDRRKRREGVSGYDVKEALFEETFVQDLPNGVERTCGDRGAEDGIERTPRIASMVSAVTVTLATWS